MKIFLLLCLASGLASTEKLDRTYLPPPGSKFSGGSSGDIQVPFEFPKETYSTERPELEDGSPEFELGINQRPKPTESAQKPGFTYFQKSVPTTTTSYAITQTTTFEPVEDEELEQPSGFYNGSTVQNSGSPKNPQTLGQIFQRRPNKEQSGQVSNYNRYQPAQNQPSNLPSYGSTTQRPQFPSNLMGQAYLPPVPVSGSRGKPISDQDINGYPAGIPTGPLYQDGQQFPSTSRPIANKPGFISPGVIQQNQVTPNSPFSTSAPQYQNGRFGSTTGPFSNGSPINTDQNQNQFQGNQNFPSTTATPQYQDVQRFSTPASVGQQENFGNQNFPSSNILPQNGQQFSTTTRLPGQNQYAGNQIQPSTAAPQYQNAQRFPTSGPFGQNQYIGNQNTIPSTVTLQSQDDYRFSTPGSVGQNRFTGIQNLPSSTAVPQYQYGQRFTTPGPAGQNQYFGNQNSAPQYQNGQQFTTPGLVGQNRYVGNQNFPSSSADPGSVGQNQFIGTQNLPTTGAPQYQDVQRFSTTGPIGQNQFIGSQNFPSSTSAPQYQNGQGYTTPGSVQQIFGSRIPNSQNQFPGNQNNPSSTVSPQYQNGQQFTSPGSEQFHQYSENQNQPQYQGGQRLTTPGSIPTGFGPISPAQENLTKDYEDFLTSTDAPQFENGQQFTTPASAQQNQFFGNQNIPSTVFPQYQDGQRFTTPAVSRLPTGQTYQGQQLGNQQYPSTAAPQYQQTLSPTPGSSQQGFIPNQNINQYPGQPGYNQQFPSSTTTQGFVPELQQYGNDGIRTVPGTAVSFPSSQSTPGTSPSYVNRPISSHTGAGPQVYGTTPSPSPNYQGFPSTASPENNLPSGSGVFTQNRPERPQAAFDRTAEILNYENIQTPEGYSYSYDTSNGIHADETGIVGNGTKAQGGFSYTGDDGKVYSVFYSADENGFQPRGDHLPTPPPIPEAIQRVIEQAHKDQESGISDDGSYNEDKYGYMKYDLPKAGLRLKNKTKPLVNGADIPNKYGNDFIELNKKQPKLKGGNKQDYQGEDINDESMDIDEQGQDKDEVYDDGRPFQGAKRIYSKRPTSMKHLADDYQKKQMNSPNKNNFKNDSPGIRRPVGGNLRPIYVENEFDDKSETNMPEDGEELQESEGADYESDLVDNYRDDPNSRTDFHGLNKYLPRPGSNKKRPLVRPDNINESVAVNQKSGKPNRKPQVSQDTVTDGQEDLIDTDYKRIPSRINNPKMRGQSNVKQSNVPSRNGIKLDSSELRTYNDYETDGEPTSEDQPNRQYKYQNGKKKVSKPTRPITKESNGINNKNIKATDQETGYEYNPPQRKFESGVTFPPRLSVTEKPKTSQNVQKGSQTTLRPFMTPNVYDNKEPIEDDDDLIDSEGKPYHPSTNENTNYPGYNKETVQNNEYPETYNNENDTTKKPSGQYDTYSTRRPYGRPQTGTEQDTIGPNRYNRPGNNQGSRRPSNKPIYGTNIPNQGVSKVESSSFVSTTPLPSSRPDVNKDYQRPGEYQTTLRPTDGSPYYDVTAPGKDGYIRKPIPSRPGLDSSRGQVPSTTYRPNYTFGDRTLAPSGSITVDGFGRPISSTKAPGYNPSYSVTEDSRIPNSDEFSGNQSRPVEEKFRPSVGRFGVTSAPTQGIPGVYQGSTSAPIGEDFSGPKQPQRFDPGTGYHYK